MIVFVVWSCDGGESERGGHWGIVGGRQLMGERWNWPTRGVLCRGRRAGRQGIARAQQAQLVLGKVASGGRGMSNHTHPE